MGWRNKKLVTQLRHQVDAFFKKTICAATAMPKCTCMTRHKQPLPAFEKHGFKQACQSSTDGTLLLESGLLALAQQNGSKAFFYTHNLNRVPKFLNYCQRKAYRTRIYHHVDEGRSTGTMTLRLCMRTNLPIPPFIQQSYSHFPAPGPLPAGATSECTPSTRPSPRQ